jgi:hypothetical protein
MFINVEVNVQKKCELQYISVTSHHHTARLNDTKEYPAEIYNFYILNINSFSGLF